AEPLRRVVPFGDEVALAIGLPHEHAHAAGLLVDLYAGVGVGTGAAPVGRVLVGGQQRGAQRIEDRPPRQLLILLDGPQGRQIDIHLSVSFSAPAAGSALPGGAPAGAPESAISRASGRE